MIDWIVYKGNIYYGEVNRKGIPHGYGTLKTEELSFEGCFKNGKMEGLMNVKDSGDYRFQVLIRHGEVIEGKVRGDVEELIMDIGVYHGGVDGEMLPYGEGEFILPDGTTIKGIWDEDGINGPFIKETLKGSVVEGVMDKGCHNGYTIVRFSNGDTMTGYVISEETEEGLKTHFDTIDLYQSQYGGNSGCPDETLDDFWEDYMRLRYHPDVIHKDSKIEMMYQYVYGKMMDSAAGYGHLLFDKDGVCLKEYRHKDNAYEKVCPYPYVIRNEKEATYFAERFYDEYHLHLTTMQKIGQNLYEWIADYETAEEVNRKGGEPGGVL